MSQHGLQGGLTPGGPAWLAGGGLTPGESAWLAGGG